MPDQITLTRPDDWHVHVRDGAALATVVPHSAAQFARAIMMPNLRPPVTTAALAEAYRQHITTKEAAQYVRGADKHLAATITAHHLLYNRNAIFTGGIRPHYYCLPVLKRETHRVALVEAATSGNRKFFLGTDSAPHPAHLKEHASGCAGCYTAHAAMELYAEAFDAAGALNQLEAFASFNGADFYGLPRNQGTITLKKES